MLVSERVENVNKIHMTLIRTYSDEGFYIEDENENLMEEAWDVPNHTHTYTETEIPVVIGEEELNNSRPPHPFNLQGKGESRHEL